MIAPVGHSVSNFKSVLIALGNWLQQCIHYDKMNCDSQFENKICICVLQMHY